MAFETTILIQLENMRGLGMCDCAFDTMRGNVGVSPARAYRAIGVTVAIACILGGHEVAAAEAAAEESSSLEVIVVTATKRAVDLQDVPFSITALSADSIEQAGVRTFEDYASKIPNLTFSAGVGVVAGRTIAIRGVQGENTTGFYIDDMPVPASVDPRVMDLQRIEVLRGPQGTLYGARSMGGTVRLITEAPDPNVFSAKVHARGSQVHDGGDGYQIDGSLNLPLMDERAALRLTVYDGVDGGFINRTYPNPADPTTRLSAKVARQEFTGGIASLIWNVTDNLTIRPTALAQHSRANGSALSDYSADTLSQSRAFDIEESNYDKWTYGGLSINYTTAFGDFTSATGYFDRKGYEVEDISEFLPTVLGSPLVPATLQSWYPTETFVEEARFTSNLAGPLQFIAGAYFNHSRWSYPQYSYVPGLDAASGGAFGTDLVYDGRGPNESKEVAVFSELTYDLTDRWSTTLGLRYSHINTTSVSQRSGIAAGDEPANGSGELTADSVTPKLVVKYEANPDVSFYALAAKGFRPGMPQVPPPERFCEEDYAERGLTPESLSSYQSDSLWSYEAGAKGRFLDRRLAVNGAIYDIEWKNLQQTGSFPCGYQFTVNAGAARSRGAELEISATPIDGLELSAGVGYEDAVITESSPTVPTPVGSPVQQVAPWNASFAAGYTFPLFSSSEGHVRADYSYTDHSFSANNDPVNPRLRKSYDILNLRGGVTTGNYEFVAFIENVFNEHANLGDVGATAGELPGRPRILVNRPRTIGIEATYRW